MSRAEIERIMAMLAGTCHLASMLLYGSGLRLQECLMLRVKDIDVAERTVIVRGGKGNTDRRTVLSDGAAAALQPHLSDVKRLHASDRAAGGEAVVLPDALSRKYPTMATDWGWQWVFSGPTPVPGASHSGDAASSPRSIGAAAGRHAGCARRGHPHACELSHVSALVRDAITLEVQ